MASIQEIPAAAAPEQSADVSSTPEHPRHQDEAVQKPTVQDTATVPALPPALVFHDWAMI